MTLAVKDALNPNTTNQPLFFTTQSLTTLIKNGLKSIVGKGKKMLVTNIFSFSHNVFYSI